LWHDCYNLQGADFGVSQCGGKGHFKKDNPNKKVMLINEETEEYETSYDVDPNSDEEDDDMLYGDASPLPTIVCSPKVLSVSPDSAEQRCNLFQKSWCWSWQGMQGYY
jgi:hypothetical protein